MYSRVYFVSVIFQLVFIQFINIIFSMCIRCNHLKFRLLHFYINIYIYIYNI